MKRKSAWFAYFFLALCVGSTVADEQPGGAGADEAPESETPDRPASEAAAEQAERFDSFKFSDELRKQLEQGQFEEVEQRFQSAIDEHPDDFYLPFFREDISRSLEQAGRPESALVHSRALADLYAGLMIEKIQHYQSFSVALGNLTRLADRVGGPKLVESTFDELERKTSELPGKNENPMVMLDVNRAGRWAGSGRNEEARTLLDDKARQAISLAERADGNNDDNDNGEAIVRASLLLKGRINLERSANGADASDLWAKLLDFMNQQATQHPDNAVVVKRFADLSIERARLLAPDDPAAAAALLDRLDPFDGYHPPPRGWPKWDKSKGMFGGYSSDWDQRGLMEVHGDVEKARVTHELIGKPAVLPTNDDGWVNVDGSIEAQNPDPIGSLHGKVVVLDFFAVWCGPCIATFPHVRKLQEEFADQGLRVVGVSEYHGYGWDEEAGRGKEQEGITHEQERAAMAQFAKHHQLNYPIVFVDRTKLHDQYLVNGIPHLVLIDRRGNMRLYRIGSVTIASPDVEQAIRECLEERPVAAD